MSVGTKQSIMQSVKESSRPSVILCDGCNSSVWTGPHTVTWLVENFIDEHGAHGVVHVVDPTTQKAPA